MRDTEHDMKALVHWTDGLQRERCVKKAWPQYGMLGTAESNVSLCTQDRIYFAETSRKAIRVTSVPWFRVSPSAVSVLQLIRREA